MADCSRPIDFDENPSKVVAGVGSEKSAVGSCETKAWKGLSFAQALCAGAVLVDGVRKVRKLWLEGRQFSGCGCGC
jgi:hypothetical protein